jgi:hypothetical protein
MSSDNIKRFKRLQREFNAYFDHLMKEGKVAKKKKQDSVVMQDPVITEPVVATTEPDAKNRSRKPDREVVVALVACYANYLKRASSK